MASYFSDDSDDIFIDYPPSNQECLKKSEEDFPATQDEFMMTLSMPKQAKIRPKIALRKRINPYLKKVSQPASSAFQDPLFFKDNYTKTVIATSTINKFVEHWEVMRDALENVSHLNV